MDNYFNSLFNKAAKEVLASNDFQLDSEGFPRDLENRFLPTKLSLAQAKEPDFYQGLRREELPNGIGPSHWSSRETFELIVYYKKIEGSKAYLEFLVGNRSIPNNPICHPGKLKDGTPVIYYWGWSTNFVDNAGERERVKSDSDQRFADFEESLRRENLAIDNYRDGTFRPQIAAVIAKERDRRSKLKNALKDF